MLSIAPRLTPTSSRSAFETDSGGRGLRVLHVVNSLELGGTQSLLARVHHEQTRRGLDSLVCVLEHASRTHEEYQSLEPSYLEFHGDYRRPWAVRGCVDLLRQTIQRVRPNIVHSYLWTSDLVSAMAVKDSPDTCHLSEVVDRRDWLASRRWLHRFRKRVTIRAFRRANSRFLAVSKAARQYAIDQLQIPTARIGVAHNGIDAEQFRSIEREPLSRDRTLVLGTTGRLEKEKGHEFLLAAMKQLLDRGQNVRLDISGDGRLRSELESQTRSLGIADHVRFLGWIDDVSQFYRTVDVFAVPSIAAEGLPTTILEAMASGCLVVASDVGGAGEAVDDGLSGFLVPPRDVASLTSAIFRIISDLDKANAMADAARLRIDEGFTTQRMVDTIVETYLDEIRRRSVH